MWQVKNNRYIPRDNSKSSYFYKKALKLLKEGTQSILRERINQAARKEHTDITQTIL